MQILRNEMQLPMHTSFLFVFISACALLSRTPCCVIVVVSFVFHSIYLSLAQVHPSLEAESTSSRRIPREPHESYNVYQYYSNWTIELTLKARNVNPYIHFCFLFTVSLSGKGKVSYTYLELFLMLGIGHSAHQETVPRCQSSSLKEMI
jgi:hypothetical protein